MKQVREAPRDYEAVWAVGGTPRTVMPLTFDQLVALAGGTQLRIAAG